MRKTAMAFLAILLVAAIGSLPVAAQDELTEFQVRLGDVKFDGPPLEPQTPEVKEPSASFKKVEYRDAHGGNQTVPRGRVWSDEGTAAARGGVGDGFTMDLAFESVDLSAGSGISGFFYTPPDTQGAVGPTDFVTTLNGAYRFHDKDTGASLGLDVAASAFWIPAVDPANNGGGDPRVRFDRINDQWIIIAFTTSAQNRLLVAISDGPEITGATVWTQYFITPGLTNGGGSLNTGGCFADYPMLGIDVNAIYLGANMFGCVGGTNAALFVLPFNGLPGGGGDASAATTAFPGLFGVANGGVWSPTPADNPDPGATQGFIVGSHISSDTILKIGRVSNPAGAPGAPTLAWVNVNISDKNDGYANGVPYTGVPNPTGAGSSWGLDPLGFRPLSGATIHDGHLWTNMTSSVDGPGGTLQLFPATGDRHSVVFFEVDLSTDTLVQDGNIFDQSTARGAEPFHTWMGALGVNGQGHAVVSASIADDSSTAPSAAWAVRRADDALGEFSEPSIFLPGTDTGNARHSFESSARPTRWGDYAKVTVDPCDDMTFYAIAEYQDTPAVATGGNWATGVARILAPPPANAVPDVGTINTSSGQAVTVTGEDFYQTPSSGMPACRTELEVTTDVAQVTATSVTFVSPTEIDIVFDATGAPSGPVTVTITNPDGQETTFGLMVGGPEIFSDGFESGDTDMWSSTS